MGEVSLVVSFLKQRKRILDEYLDDIKSGKLEVKDTNVEIYKIESKQISVAIKKLKD